MTDDAHLLRAYVENKSEAAFAELVERHLGLVYYSAVRQLGSDAHLARDITQNVFILLAQKAPSLLGHPSLAGWLHVTSHFKVVKMREAERRRRAREESAYAMQKMLAESRSDADWEQIHPILDEVLLELSERDREAILLRFFGGHPFSTIGIRLSLTEKAAHMRVERALDKLRERFAGRGITSSAAILATILGSHASMAAPGELVAIVTGAAMASVNSVGSLPNSVALATSAPAGVVAFVGVSAILSLISIGTAAYEFRNFFRDQASLKATSAQFETEQDLLRRLGQTAQIADKNLANLRRQFDQLRAVHANRATSTAKVTIAKGMADWQLLKLAFPQARELAATMDKAQIQRNYGLFFQRAALTPAQIREFENRTIELIGENTTIAPNSIQSTVKQLPDDQMRAIFGNQIFQQFQDYNRMIPANVVAVFVRSSASIVGVPISAAQEEEVAQIIADNSRAYKNGESIDPLSIDWETAQTQTQTILSPAQWAAAEGVFLNFQYQLALAQTQQAESFDWVTKAGN
jgi:RNA polymerase sigma factor (sigma-70 family)